MIIGNQTRHMFLTVDVENLRICGYELGIWCSSRILLKTRLHLSWYLDHLATECDSLSKFNVGFLESRIKIVQPHLDASSFGNASGVA